MQNCSRGCFCTTQIKGVKYIEKVSGCIHINENNKRCKKQRLVKYGNELYSCEEHNTEISRDYQNKLDSFK
jgi:hypothetical protein